MSLCLACGLCCDGTLFRGVPVSDVEVEQLVQLGLRVHENRLSHPCVAHGDQGCSVYEARPSGCRSYRCALLRKLDAGTVTESEALDVVRATRAGDARARRYLSSGVYFDSMAGDT